MRVLIPFGTRKIYDVGYVVNLKEKSEYKCKNIVKVIDKVFDENKAKEIVSLIEKANDLLE